MRPCSFPTRAAAYKKGRELRKLFPKGWKQRVWENLGWHLAFSFTPYVNVHFSPEQGRSGQFFCLMGTEGGGRPEWSARCSSSNPMVTVRANMKLAIQDTAERIKMLRICNHSLIGKTR